MFAPAWTRGRSRPIASSAETETGNETTESDSTISPREGCDSQYGVASFEWGEDPRRLLVPDPSVEERREDEVKAEKEDLSEGRQVHIIEAGETGPFSSPPPTDVDAEETPVQHLTALMDSPEIAAFSAPNVDGLQYDKEMTEASISRLSASHLSTLRRLTASPPPSSRPETDTDFDTDTDLDMDLDLESGTEASSAPPSPTSLTSLPSYVPSISSVSRSSSPVSAEAGQTGGGGRWTRGAPGAVLSALARDREHARVARATRHKGRGQAGETAGAQLVIPELSLPSSSLHLSLRKWDGPVGGAKIVLLGPPELTRRVVASLGEREELVEIQGRKGNIGVLRGDQVVGVVVTGMSQEQVRMRTLKAYSTLHGLLNPSAGRQDETQLAGLVAGFSERDDWVHAVAGVDEVSREQADRLHHLVPVLQTPSSFASATSSPSPPTTDEQTHHQGLDDPTPMARFESTSYVTSAPSDAVSPLPTVYSPSLEPLLPAAPVFDSHGIAQCIIRALDNNETRTASVSRFLAWRPPSLDSSDSSLDSVGPPASASALGASGLDAPVLMPTVARAQGGAEWEAALSRRIAKRRELGVRSDGTASEMTGTVASRTGTASRRASGGASGAEPARRRRSKGKKEAPPPLFPIRPPSPSSGRRGTGCGDTSGLGLGTGSGSVARISKMVRAFTDGVYASVMSAGKSGTGRWKGWVVAALVVGVVGLGVYLGRDV